MLRSDKLFRTLTEEISKVSYKKEIIKGDSRELNEKFEIPIGVLTDYMTLRVPVDDASDFVLYALSSHYLSSTELSNYFTPKEIEFYESSKFEIERIKFPIELPMIQVTPDQWIGTISVKQLIEFRDAQIINYNERTQRTMERKIAHGREYYQISINEVAVKAIEHSYETDSYIPNTLTLNISEESEADFMYDPDNHMLIINQIKFFDIVDGYHRYRAISKIVTKNPKFDYQMELRIVCFSETKARQFIWQEDQKTKMSKVLSDSYNQSDYSVFITEKINEAYPNTVSRNKGIISFAHLSDAISYFYNTEKIKNVTQAVIISKEIIDDIEVLITEDPTIFDKTWKKSKTYSTICVFSQKSNQQHYVEDIKKLEKISKEPKNAEYLWSVVFNRRKASALIKLMKDNNI